MIDVDIRQRLGAFELDVAFKADARVVGLFGRSGSGKTSVVNALAGTTHPQSGHIVVNGETLFDSARGIDLPPEKRRLGYVFQDDLLFPHLNVEANLLYGFRLARAATRVIEPQHVIDLLGLRELLHRVPDKLSGGEKQRVAIGRALLAQPRLILMDEPLASLDVARRNEVLRYIERLRDDLRIPIVYVTHSLTEITRLADTVVLLADGKAVSVGDVDTLMTRADLRAYTGHYEAGAVIDTTVSEHDAAFDLTTLVFDGGKLIVPGVARPIGERVRVRVRARDVSLSLEQPTAVSVLNVLRATLVAFSAEEGASVEVQLRVGATSMVAQITRRSRSLLKLVVGQQVYALVKAVSFDRHSVGFDS